MLLKLRYLKGSNGAFSATANVINTLSENDTDGIPISNPRRVAGSAKWKMTPRFIDSQWETVAMTN